MKMVEKIGSSALLLIISFFNFFSFKNKDKNLNLFLYKRDIDYFTYNSRVFIKMDSRGREFIKTIINDFREYTQDTKYGKSKFKNEHVLKVYGSKLFEFEFIDETYWNHFTLAIRISELGDLQMLVDDLFMELIRSIDFDKKQIIEEMPSNA